MSADILATLGARRGHFALESGHHSDLWFDLETLCRRPKAIRPLATAIAGRLAPYAPEAICGPLVEGAYVAMMVAEELGVEFVYAERFADSSRATMFPVEYRLPGTLRPLVPGKRVAIVNDVISAGSAVRGAMEDLRALDARIVAVGALVVLGDAFPSYAARQDCPIEFLARRPFHLWIPADCPLCASGAPLT